MVSATSTATTATAQIIAPGNVHYNMPAQLGLTFQVTPHEPTPR